MGIRGSRKSVSDAQCAMRPRVHPSIIRCGTPRFRWKAVGGDFPNKVCGDYYVAPKWQGVYPQKDYGGHFEIEIEAIDTGDGNVDWVASKKGPPGTCNYKFIMEDGSVTVRIFIPLRSYCYNCYTLPHPKMNQSIDW